jgi:anthranilate synthase/aminodeoxychorismate synthase-like glutamine amidotransferase
MSKTLKMIKPTPKKQLLFFENNDSFSWNVIDALPFSRSEIKIIHHSPNNKTNDSLDGATHVVIGPGPMDPIRNGLTELVRSCAEKGIPTLGICLGFQAIGMAFGAKLIRTSPIHGKRSKVNFTPSRFFPAFEGDVEVMRYHSLSLEQMVSPLNIIATSSEGIPMALEHDTLSIAGFQFHPDSFATLRGQEMIHSFFNHAL